MVKVENKETLRLLTKRFMKMNRARNIIAVIAIMLTSLLFTSLFVGSVSMILSKRATEIKQFMDSSHAIAQNLSEEDAERLQKTIEQSDEVERYGTGIFLGAGRDKHFGFSVEVRYADKNMAESFNCLPTTGRLPEKENEVAVSSLVLEALGVTPKIGEEVTLTWEVNPMLKQYKTDTFQICGFWQGDKAVLGQMVWVSEAYAKENCYPVTQKELENGIYNGGKEYSVWYKNLWNLEKKTENISKTAGFLIATRKTNYSIYSSINPQCSILRGESPVALLKAIRNEQEIAGIHAAMRRDGVALVKFLKWLEESVSTGKETELSIDKKLHEFRAAQPLYMGVSFDTIAGYKEHGAIVHYSATPESDVTLQPRGFLDRKSVV